MVVTPTYQVKIKLHLKDKNTYTPLINQPLKIMFYTRESDILGALSAQNIESVTTDNKGVVETTLTGEGNFEPPVKIEYAGNEIYKPFIINLLKTQNILWNPVLDGTNGANYKYSYSESNGQGVGKGFVLKNGFENTKFWQLTFDFKHDNLRYTGPIFLCNVETYTIPDSDQNTNVLKGWEGSWPNGDKYYNITQGSMSNITIDWFDVTVTKIDNTHVRLESETLDRDTVVEVPWLSSATYLSCGAVHNHSSDSFGPCRIKNVKVNNIVEE